MLNPAAPGFLVQPEPSKEEGMHVEDYTGGERPTERLDALGDLSKRTVELNETLQQEIAEIGRRRRQMLYALAFVVFTGIFNLATGGLRLLMGG